MTSTRSITILKMKRGRDGKHRADEGRCNNVFEQFALLQHLSQAATPSRKAGLVGEGMTALDEDRLALPDLGEVQLIDGKHNIVGGARVPNNCDRALGRISARFFQYQGTAILGAQYGGERSGESRQLLKRHPQRTRFETEFFCYGNERRSIRLPRRQREAPPQLINAYVQAQT